MRRLIALVLGLILLVLALNLVWLSRSTSRLTNASDATLNDVTVLVGGYRIVVGMLRPGERRLVFLPQSGDASYQINYTIDGRPMPSPCQEYVEGDMFHVESVLVGGEADRCVSTLPLFSDLFVLKLLE